jgi:hypothetical protein
MVENKERAAGNCCPFLFMVTGIVMRTLIIVSLLTLSLASALSQEVAFTMTIRNITPVSTSSGTFTFGAHKNATNGLDVELGEREIPSLPPPAGVYIIYTAPPTPDRIWLSPKDLRTLSSDSSVRHDYDLNITWTGGRLELFMNQRLPLGIDSAYIVDAITDFPDNFIKARVDSGMVYATDNRALTRFKLLVWYRQTTSSVNEAWNSSVVIAPNPTSDVLSVTGCEPGWKVDVLTVVGHSVRSYITESESIRLHVHDLPIGAYVVRVVDQRGRVMQRIMMHQ